MSDYTRKENGVQYYDMSQYDSGNRMRIERSVFVGDDYDLQSIIEGRTQEEVIALLERRKRIEAKAFEEARQNVSEWECAAAEVQAVERALQVMRTKPVKHTSNVLTASEYDWFEISNRVYKFIYHIQVRTKYDAVTKQLVPDIWVAQWRCSLNTPPTSQVYWIAGLDKKCKSVEEAEKYIKGRLKAYSRFFTEENPRIPGQFAKHFKVNGVLLPGYKVAEDATAESEV